MEAPTTDRETIADQPLALGRFWTASNVMSMARFVLVAPITYLILVDGSRAWLFGLIGVGVLTDWLDGKIARWTGTVSEWGRVLDPLADKAAAIFISLALYVKGVFPLWFLALVFARDVSVGTGGMLMTRKLGYVVSSLWSGKVAVTCLALTVLAALLRADPEVMDVLIVGTSVVMAYSFVRYLLRFIRVMAS